MKVPVREIDYRFELFDGKIFIYAGRGYFQENGDYKATLRIPVDASCASDGLFEQIRRFQSIYAIDTNKLKVGQHCFSISCAVHVCLEYLGVNQWNAIFTRLPAVVSMVDKCNPELLAWRRILEILAPKIEGTMALVVDSELEEIPLFNARKKSLCDDFVLPENSQLIYASAERDAASPLNKAIRICDVDAKNVAETIKKRCDTEKIYNNIFFSKNGYIFISPTYL